jgi:hypothetical protein
VAIGEAWQRRGAAVAVVLANPAAAIAAALARSAIGWTTPAVGRAAAGVLTAGAVGWTDVATEAAIVGIVGEVRTFATTARLVIVTAIL